MVLTSLVNVLYAGLILFVGGLGVILYQWVGVLALRRKLPPGPLPWPLIGNLYQLRRRDKQWETLAEWSKEYNDPMITFWTGCSPTIVCNDAWTASELNDRRAHNYSSRPYMVVTGKLFGFYHDNQAGMPYSDHWRLHRRLTHTVTNASVVANYQPFQSNETKLLLRDCLERPDEYVRGLERYTVSVVATIAWGRRIDRADDPVLKIAQAFVGTSTLALPGKCWTEAIPLLAEMPPFLNTLPVIMKHLANSSNKYFYALSEEGAVSKTDSFAKRLFQSSGENGLNRVDIANLTGNFIGAGVDTTTSSLITFILAMCLHADAQKKAHEELDRVVGSNRMPDWSDEGKLKYVAAIVKEILRWRPVFPLGGPQHSPVQDDEFRGYLVPKGVPIIGNLHAIMHNAREYPDPEAFKPERWLAEIDEGSYPTKKGHHAFGWGRRVCSGEALAQQSLVSTISALLWAFEIRPGLDDTGKEVTLDPNAYGIFQVARPLPFKARFIPRSEKTRSMVIEQAVIAREQLREFDGETLVSMQNCMGVSLDEPPSIKN